MHLLDGYEKVEKDAESSLAPFKSTEIMRRWSICTGMTNSASPKKSRTNGAGNLETYGIPL
jgi:hypothetical protein